MTPLEALEQFCRAITSGKLSLGKNPYCVEEFKIAMQAIARARGKSVEGSAWTDALESAHTS